MSWRNMVMRMVTAIGLVAVVQVSPGLAQAVEHAYADGIEQAKRATVGLLPLEHEAASEAGRSHFIMRATGIHLHDGYLLTAHHAVEQEERGTPVVRPKIRVLTTDLQELSAKLIGVSRFLDLAVYRLEQVGSPTLPEIRFAEREPQAGDDVFTVGYPLGWGPAFGFGRIGNPSTFLGTAETRLMQLDLAVCSGNSGGGLFGKQGELVGMMHAIIETRKEPGAQHCSQFAFAVPGPLVKRVVTAVIDGKQPAFPRLGIGLATVQQGTRWRVAAGEVAGPAKDAGMRKGDIILEIDGMEVTTGAQLKNYLIERKEPGQKTRVKVLRGEEELALEVTLGMS